MQRALRVDPRDATPIWRQIEEGLRRLVASGALAPGTGVPSVREMAADLRINPATVAKAYQRLTDAGVLAVRRGEGTFVAEFPPSLPKGSARFGQGNTILVSSKCVFSSRHGAGPCVWARERT